MSALRCGRYIEPVRGLCGGQPRTKECEHGNGAKALFALSSTMSMSASLTRMTKSSPDFDQLGQDGASHGSNQGFAGENGGQEPIRLHESKRRPKAPLENRPARALLDLRLLELDVLARDGIVFLEGELF